MAFKKNEVDPQVINQYGELLRALTILAYDHGIGESLNSWFDKRFIGKLIITGLFKLAKDGTINDFRCKVARPPAKNGKPRAINYAEQWEMQIYNGRCLIAKGMVVGRKAPYPSKIRELRASHDHTPTVEEIDWANQVLEKQLGMGPNYRAYSVRVLAPATVVCDQVIKANSPEEAQQKALEEVNKDANRQFVVPGPLEEDTYEYNEGDDPEMGWIVLSVGQPETTNPPVEMPEDD